MFCGKLFQWSLSISRNIFSCVYCVNDYLKCLENIGIWERDEDSRKQILCPLVLFYI